MPLELVQKDAALALSLLNEPEQPETSDSSDIERVRRAMAQLQEPVPVQQLRKLCGMRMASVCSALAELKRSGVVVHDPRGYQIKAVSVSLPIDPKGNGNGKRPFEDP
jgi:predicted Rossmann fold nucleotide-binding protein DprA/Smf involved in DNA uptake